jgi:hypothetical protein
METKTELPKEWIELADKESCCSSEFLTGAKAMRDAMEKMLNDKIVLAYVKSNLEPDLKGSYLQQSTYYQELLTELTSLTPTQDGK